MKRWTKILLFCLCSLTLVSWDRVTKDMAKEHLMNNAPVSFFHNKFRLEYAENTGAAMNMGDGLPKAASFWLLSILPLAFMLGLAFYAIKNSKEMPLPKMMAFALLIAGGLGNIIDRLLFDRHVTDFMIINMRHIRSGIFNFADVFVTMGAICLLLSYTIKTRLA